MIESNEGYSRQIVEMLFRSGFLRVVIATGTLALGINMPCKTVVFSGDSVYLTALNFRQGAGRAGRRGFDPLGNVVFHGVSGSKVMRLMGSRLPDLNGHFPLTTSLLLRLFGLLSESRNAPFAVRSINALLSQPRLCLGGEESRMMVLHHVRFSIEYLRRQHLLSAEGAPLNFASCTTHLYYTENSSFAFHALLKSGYFNTLCGEIHRNQKRVLSTLMLTLAHIFGRQVCRQADTEFIEKTVKRSPSIVFLPRLPTLAANVLKTHNSDTLSIFLAYVRTFVAQHISKPDHNLPLTNIQLGGSANADVVAGLPTRSPVVMRSPFVALSGHGDVFKTIRDLCTSTRYGVFLEEAVVPHTTLHPQESATPLNAYLYDFFKHGDAKALTTANGIRQSDLWYLLNDFSLILATIVTSLTNFLKLSPESDLDHLDIKGSGDAAIESKEDSLLPPEAEPSLVSENGSAGAAKQKDGPAWSKKKGKVLDSWDEGEAGDVSDDETPTASKHAKTSATTSQGGPSPDDDGDVMGNPDGLLDVLKAFKLLQAEFDAKFKAIWS